MTREDYDRYVAAFNARDYDAVFAALHTCRYFAYLKQRAA